jgi:hypothetical protein
MKGQTLHFLEYSKISRPIELNTCCLIEQLVAALQSRGSSNGSVVADTTIANSLALKCNTNKWGGHSEIPRNISISLKQESIALASCQSCSMRT